MNKIRVGFNLDQTWIKHNLRLTQIENSRFEIDEVKLELNLEII